MGKQINETEREQQTADSAQEERQARRLGRVQFLLVAVFFIGVLLVVEVISILWGKTTGTIVLALIGLATAVFLYKDEILRRLRRKGR